jgi:hypothetical protein
MAYGGSSVTFTKTTLVSEVETIITDAFGTTISISTTDLTAIPVSGIQFCDEAGTVPMTLTFEHVKGVAETVVSAELTVSTSESVGAISGSTTSTTHGLSTSMPSAQAT